MTSLYGGEQLPATYYEAYKYDTWQQSGILLHVLRNAIRAERGLEVDKGYAWLMTQDTGEGLNTGFVHMHGIFTEEAHVGQRIVHESHTLYYGDQIDTQNKCGVDDPTLTRCTGTTYSLPETQGEIPTEQESYAHIDKIHPQNRDRLAVMRFWLPTLVEHVYSETTTELYDPVVNRGAYLLNREMHELGHVFTHPGLQKAQQVVEKVHQGQL